MYAYLRLCALAVIAFHLIAPYFAIEHVWGAGGFPMIPLPSRLLLAAAAVLFLWPKLAEGAWRRSCEAWASARRRLPASVLFGLVALLSLPLFWVGRLRHLRWGDAYIFANAISHPEARLTYTWQAPLDVYLHAKAWSLANRVLGWDVQTTYAAISCLVGGLFVFAVLSAARGLYGDRLSAGVLAGLVLTLGAMQLFFGYVESYTIVPLGIVIFLWLGLRFLRGQGGLWTAAAVLAFTHGLSPSTLPLSLALFYLAWAAWRRGTPVWRVSCSVVVPMALVAGGIVALFTAGGHGPETLFGADAPGGGDRRWLVPLLHTGSRWEHYTMFSWAHVRDFVNEQALVAPLVLPVVLGGVVALRRGSTPRDREYWFVALAAGAYVLLTFAWNPDYGGRRDWDLFAPAAIPLAFLAAYLLNRSATDSVRTRALPLIVAVSLMHLLPWVWFNAQPWPWD